MKKVFVYGTAVLALSAAPLLAQQPSGAGSAGARQGSSATSPQPASPSGTRSGAGDQAGSSARTPTQGSSQLASADRQFIMEAARGGMAEVELGQLASDKAQSDAVKQFAQRMVTDHGKANDELKSLAQSKNVTLPAELDAKHKSTKDRLSKLSGAQFDRAYMQEMVSDHQKDVSEFRKQSQSAKDAELKAWAAKTLPTLQEHLQMAQAASRNAVGTSGTRSTGSEGDKVNGGTRGTTPGTGATTPGTGATSPRPQTPDAPSSPGNPGSSTPR
jgi:putative membrane protein